MTEQAEIGSEAPRRPLWPKLVLLCVIVAVAAAVYLQFGESLTLQNVAQRESQLRQFQQDHPILVYGVAFGIYVAITGMSLPGATGLTLLYAWFFGFWKGVLLVSVASTAGATLAFLLSRYLFRDAVLHRFGERLAAFNQALEREGPFYLFTLRLIPAVPFFIINVVMGLTPIRTRTYWWVSQIGMLPGTCVYVYAGSAVPNLQKLSEEGINAALPPAQVAKLLVAFALLGLFPLVVKRLIQRFSKTAE